MTPVESKNLLLFGASGAIGGAVKDLFSERGWRVIGATRRLAHKDDPNSLWVELDPFGKSDSKALQSNGPYHAVCWAQGANANDNVYTVDSERHLEIYRANCLFILLTLKQLLAEQLLENGARLCVISSIWQNLARQDKLSYCMSKAALQGLVLSAAADLAKDGFLINAVLPGALETPMTRANLEPEQMAKIKAATKFDKLPQLEDVANLTYFLCSDDNTGITGQFIAADLGFSRVRLI